MHTPKNLAHVALLGLALASTAALADDRRYYLSGSVGYQDVDDFEIDAGPIFGDLALDDGWSAGIAFGADFDGPLRLEAEFVQRQADGSAFDALGFDQAAGELQVRTLMINAIADLPIDGASVVPYIGGGIGWAMVELDDAGSSFLRIDAEDDSTLGVQALVGIAFPVNEDLSLSIDARYLTVQADDIDYRIEGTAFEGEADVTALSLVGSLRFSF